MTVWTTFWKLAGREPLSDRCEAPVLLNVAGRFSRKFRADPDFRCVFFWTTNRQRQIIFLIYIKLCQHAKQYVYVPEIVACEHLWPFWENGPKWYKKDCPKSVYFSFFLGYAEYFVSMPKIVTFEATRIVSYFSCSLYPMPAMLINAISSFIDRFS